jgi:two-component system NtrC family sensor kinase
VQKADSVVEMEDGIVKGLGAIMGIRFCRVSYRPQSLLYDEDSGRSEVTPFLAYQKKLKLGEEQIGLIEFVRTEEKEFITEEKDLLDQVSEAVSFAIDRLNRLEELEALKVQWQATFDAIKDPVCLIGEDYRVIRQNNAFYDNAKDQAVKDGEFCYQLMFGRDQPCQQCQLGKNFVVEAKTAETTQSQVWQVFSNKKTGAGQKEHFVNLYRDISQKVRLENRILESAKMAELGTVGGSIAHELNNPLAGIITYLQLIRGDLKGDEPYYADIIEMEKAANRCKDIVNNLLGFARKASRQDPEEISIQALVDEAMKIINVHTKAIGVEFEYIGWEKEVDVKVAKILTVQSFVNLLQIASFSVENRMREEKGFTPKILLQIEEKKDSHLIHIGFDSEFVLSPMSVSGDQVFDMDQRRKALMALQFTVASQLLEEQNCGVDLVTGKYPKTVLSVFFQRISN